MGLIGRGSSGWDKIRILRGFFQGNKNFSLRTMYALFSPQFNLVGGKSYKCFLRIRGLENYHSLESFYVLKELDI